MLYREIKFKKRVSREDSRQRIGTVLYKKDCYFYYQVYYKGEERDLQNGIEYAKKYNNSYCEFNITPFSKN